MNPRSGGGKVARFQLVERAESMGALVRLIGDDDDVASLARRAVEEGAEVLAAAGGDGTVSTVAAVAAEADRPLLVVPAGTRNHFARDLGLDIRNPASALEALRGGESARVDLGFVDSRAFVNNVSFGVYAEALLNPHYREAKARAVVSVARPVPAGTPVGRRRGGHSPGDGRASASGAGLQQPLPHRHAALPRPAVHPGERAARRDRAQARPQE